MGIIFKHRSWVLTNFAYISLTNNIPRPRGAVARLFLSCECIRTDPFPITQVPSYGPVTLRGDRSKVTFKISCIVLLQHSLTSKDTGLLVHWSHSRGDAFFLSLTCTQTHEMQLFWGRKKSFFPMKMFFRCDAINTKRCMNLYT